MRIAPSLAVLVIAVAGAGTLAACRDEPPAPRARPVVHDAAVTTAPIDAAAAAIDAGDAPLTPAVGERGVQIRDLQYGGFAAPGLPAIREDGSELAAVAQADDGGRGYLALRFVVLDGATGKVKTTIALADASETADAEHKDDEAGNFAAEEALFAQVRERVAKANALVGGAGWRTLVTTAREDSGPPQPIESIAIGDLQVRYDGARRKLDLLRNGQVAAMHDVAKLVGKASPRADTPCPGDVAYLEAVHVDLPTKKALVELGAWPQGHNCGSAGPTYTVVALP